MLEKITRFATITLIAAMVWLYAEGATRKQHSVTMRVRFVAPKGQNLLISPPTVSTSATVRCATSQAQHVREEFEKNEIIIEVSDVPGTPFREFQLDREFQVHQQVNRLGITIERVEPNTVNLRVERLLEESVPIKLVMPEDLELAGPPTLTPETGTIIVPASHASEVVGVRLIAPLDQNALAGVVPGVPTDRENIPLTLPPGLASSGFQFRPDRVKVTFTVKKKEDEFVVGLVPVLLNIAPNLARQYEVVVDQESLLLRDIKVKGPSDMISRIKSGQLRVEAMLRLDPEDLEKKIPSKLPELRLPPGVSVDSTPPLIKFTITPRESVLPPP